MTNFDLAKVTPVATDMRSLWIATKDINGNIVLTNQSQVADIIIHDREENDISSDILSDEFAQILENALPGTPAAGYAKELNNMDEQTRIDSNARSQNILPATQLTSTTLSTVINNISSRINIFTENGEFSSFVPLDSTNNLRKVSDNTIITGIAAGEDETRYGAWISPIYSSSTQKTTTTAAGYNAKSFGGTIGFDTKINDDAALGLAFSYVNTISKFKDFKSGDKTKMQSLLLSLYGVKQLSNNFFIQSVLTVANTKVHSREKRITDTQLQTAKSDYTSISFGAELLGGYNYFIKNNYIITPMAGFGYKKINGNSYEETGTTNQNLSIKRKALDGLDLIAGIRILTDSFLVKNINVIPEIHGFLRYDLTNKPTKVVSSLDSGTGQTFSKSSKPTRTFGNIGTSISAHLGTIVCGIGYDINLAKKFIGHQGSLKVRVDF